ncbi:MAG TPA: hypothetical protein VKI18_10530 [Albitalea sp.]|nr:hypothetical protein [Albitalea sp.]
MNKMRTTTREWMAGLAAALLFAPALAAERPAATIEAAKAQALYAPMPPR